MRTWGWPSGPQGTKGFGARGPGARPPAPHMTEPGRCVPSIRPSPRAHMAPRTAPPPSSCSDPPYRCRGGWGWGSRGGGLSGRGSPPRTASQWGGRRQHGGVGLASWPTAFPPSAACPLGEPLLPRSRQPPPLTARLALSVGATCLQVSLGAGTRFLRSVQPPLSCRSPSCSGRPDPMELGLGSFRGEFLCLRCKANLGLVHCVGELESETMSSAQANEGGNRRGARRYKLGWESGRGGRAPGRGCTPVISRLLRTRRPLLPAPAGQALVKAVGSAPTPSRAPGRLPVRPAPSVRPSAACTVRGWPLTLRAAF